MTSNGGIMNTWARYEIHWSSYEIDRRMLYTHPGDPPPL